MAGVLPRLAPARMYLSALCSAAAAASFSRCSLGSLSACTGHQPLDGRCTHIKKPLAVRCKFGLSFCNNFTRFLPICAPRSFYNGRHQQDGICMVPSIFRPYPLFKCALMAAKSSPRPALNRTRGAFYNPSQIETDLRMALSCALKLRRQCGKEKVHRRRRNRGSVLGTAAEVGCQHINELRICRRLRQRMPRNVFQQAMVRLPPTSLHQCAQISLHAAA